ncbi:conserved hypothetical protein [Streptomyces scabiei 87.22]|uniref:HTH cro/C1-type domain-containing protein n=2 Tax=Streptomyces scabiei TaxID=1930 RepID=C9Z3W8_STRSW|nr:helix-turn-helix transcriptional regulator [Streptomyces scabiei]MDX2575426.1 helix-turn-helix domain-containing protein [Streptomyces scabiei]MDX2653094.1 helix-turn-helix domain-containing protein [Streptomyces scabiei]MDX2718851.1 helix-turn-helix domain-containing protein [Streptomyces scabiei]MDX2865097.1 helix-turn-helix domain-containing protein [Streptomyces scabiei]MDX2883553.1 helix-turn-helix domain-containing protein [Streptomyces scabiei]
MDSIHDDIAEFALLLTRLKARTDRSYAALARRLDLHASTLHRYCSGEAVPQDFAVIERFAVLCGASPEERSELHRRWIMAYATRQRSRPSGTRQTRAPQVTTDPAASLGPAGAAPANSGRSAVEAPGVIPPTGRSPEPSAPPRPRVPGGRDRRRPVRATALAASLVAALLGLTSSAAGTPSGSVTRGDLKPNQADAGAAPVVAPLTWTADFHTRGLNGCGEDYVVDKGSRQVPPPPNLGDVEAWVTSQRAVHAGTADVQIMVQGRGSAAVVLDALYVRVVDRAAPAVDRGVVYSLSDGCGAGILPRYFAVDLDAHRPRARSMPGDDGAGTRIPAIDFPYRVSLQKPEVLVVTTLNRTCTCDWYLDLAWSSQGRTGTVRVDDNGRPFRSTSITGLEGYRYDRISHQPGRWVPIPAANMAADGG